MAKDKKRTPEFDQKKPLKEQLQAGLDAFGRDAATPEQVTLTQENGSPVAVAQDVRPDEAVREGPLAPVADAVARLEGLANLPPDLQAVAQRIARPGESLVQAVERLEALAKRAVDAERDRDEARAEAGRLSFDNGVLLSTNDAAMNTPFRALEGEHRVSGVIVEDVEGGKHRVHVLERGEDKALTLWAVERGDAMPWHAAKVLVDRVVETKLTPEDKR